MKYRIRFYTYWHCGSGLSGGSSADALVVRDEEGLPYVPGRTIKGHLREAAEILGNQAFVSECFGESDDKPGCCHFTDAFLPYEVEKGKRHYLYDRLSMTAIDPESGTAKDDTLRSIEAVVPLELEGEVIGVPQKYLDEMKRTMGMVKRIGLRRHRGLGRCDIEAIGEEK